MKDVVLSPQIKYSLINMKSTPNVMKISRPRHSSSVARKTQYPHIYCLCARNTTSAPDTFQFKLVVISLVQEFSYIIPRYYMQLHKGILSVNLKRGVWTGLGLKWVDMFGLHVIYEWLYINRHTHIIVYIHLYMVTVHITVHFHLVIKVTCLLFLVYCIDNNYINRFFIATSCNILDTLNRY